MSPRRIADDSESLTQEDVTAWLQQQIDHSRKATKLRIAGAREIAVDFAGNRISREEVADRIYQYEKRWGEALPGVWTTQGKTDQQILAELDETRVRQQARRKNAGKTQSGIRERDR